MGSVPATEYRGRILIVDGDDVENSMGFSADHLRGFGFDVHLTSDVEEAEKIFNDGVNLMIVEPWSMDRYSPREAERRKRPDLVRMAKPAGVPVILVSATLKDQISKEYGLTEGKDYVAYLLKPHRLDDLRAAVEHVL